MAFINHEPVAFMKLNLFSNLPEHDIEKGLELDKIYILPRFKGMKIGKRLLDLAFDIAKRNKKEIFWLSVIDTNVEAISFYEKIGFQFHSKTQLDYPKFKEELKGMWRMYFELPIDKTIVSSASQFIVNHKSLKGFNVNNPRLYRGSAGNTRHQPQRG